MITKLTSKVPESAGEITAEKYIMRAWPLLGKNRAEGLFKARQVKANGARIERTAILKAGDELCAYLEGEYDFSLPILFRENGIIAVNKPSGLPVDIDGDGIGEDTVLSRLKKTSPDARLVHRLDTDTSGVLLAAEDEKTEAYLTGLFKNHLLVKQYSCTVIGAMPRKHETLKGFLIKDSDKATVRIVPAKIKNALEIETIYTVKTTKTLNGYTLSNLLVEIPTGRTHQIRAQLAHIGHPLLGDDKYGDRRANKALNATKTNLTCESITVKNTEEAGAYAGYAFKLKCQK